MKSIKKPINERKISNQSEGYIDELIKEKQPIIIFDWKYNLISKR